MTPKQHYAEAVRLITYASMKGGPGRKHLRRDDEDFETDADAIAVAQVHATLAAIDPITLI